MLLLDGHRGRYLPQAFAFAYGEEFDYEGKVYGMDYGEALDVLIAGPDTEDYWDVWLTILDNARFKENPEMILYTNEEGDLFLLTPEEFEEVESGLTTVGTYDPWVQS